MVPSVMQSGWQLQPIVLLLLMLAAGASLVADGGTHGHLGRQTPLNSATRQAGYGGGSLLGRQQQSATARVTAGPARMQVAGVSAQDSTQAHGEQSLPVVVCVPMVSLVASVECSAAVVDASWLSVLQGSESAPLHHSLVAVPITCNKCKK